MKYHTCCVNHSNIAYEGNTREKAFPPILLLKNGRRLFFSSSFFMPSSTNLLPRLIIKPTALEISGNMEFSLVYSVTLGLMQGESNWIRMHLEVYQQRKWNTYIKTCILSSRQGHRSTIYFASTVTIIMKFCQTHMTY